MSGITLPTEAWTFLIAQAFLFGGLWAVTRYRVTQLEKGQEKTEKAIVAIAEAAARAENVKREDEKILKEIEKLETEMRQGFVYFGECLGNLTMLVNTHDTWLSTMEKTVAGAGGSRPRTAAVKTPAAPEWLPPRAHVPPIGARHHDPRRDPDR